MFEALRYGTDGLEQSDCVLNDPAVRGAPILVAGSNFGCGSSREGAVWALMGAGFRCVIAESFGDIFYSNCFQNGMLPVVLSGTGVAEIAAAAAAAQGALLRIDLTTRTVVAPGMTPQSFSIDCSRRNALLKGLDDLGQSLLHVGAIGAWQSADRSNRPWMWDAVQA